MVIILFLVSCQKERPLALYEGKWKPKEDIGVLDLVDPGEFEKSVNKVSLIIASRISASSYWEIKDGGIYRINAGESTRIDHQILQDNFNFAEVLVFREDYGYWVLRIRLRNEELEIFPNRFSRDHVVMESFE